MKLSSRSQRQLSAQKIIFLLLFFCSIFMLAWISNHYSYQFDLTANKRHSLSSSSIDLLKLLDKPISVHAYTTDEITQKAVIEIISRYQRIKSNFKLRLLNPDIDLEQAQQDGITMNKPFAFVIYYNAQLEHIDSLSEQAISNALLRLNKREKQQVIFLSGHGEQDIEGKNQRSYASLNKQLSDKGFQLKKINLLEQGIPDNTKLIVIAAPLHPYLQGESDAILQFIDNGGNLLWLSDPSNESNAEKSNNGNLQGLDKLATSLGLQFHQGIIIDNNPELRQTLNIQHPAIIPVTEYFPHLITNNIQYNTLFPMAHGISPLTNTQSVNNWQAAALFNSSAKSWTEASGISEEMVFNSSDGDIAGPVTVAVALTRPAPGNSNKQLQQRIVVIADSDFLAERYIGAGANLTLGLNVFNWLTGDDDVINIKPLATPDSQLMLNDTELAFIGIGFFLVLPFILLITAYRIWSVRQKR